MSARRRLPSNPSIFEDEPQASAWNVLKILAINLCL